MTENDIKLVERLWDGGTPICEIVKLLPYKQHIVKQNIAELKRKGVLKGRSGKSRGNTQEKVLQAYKGGTTSPHEIAENLGLCYQYVVRLLGEVAYGRKRPPRNYKQKPIGEKTKKIVEELKLGKSGRKIAREFGVSFQYVYKVKKKFVDNKRGNIESDNRTH